MLDASVTSVCNPHNNEMFAHSLNFARTLPLSLWIAFGGLTYITGEWYFFWLSHTYLFTYFVVHPVLGTLILPSGPVHPDCDSRQYVGPALEVLLLYQYLGQATLHAVVWHLKMHWFSIVWRLVLAVGIPWALHYSGNYSATQLIEGASVGVALGAVYMYLVMCLVRPRLLQLNNTWIARLLDMYTAHDISHVFYHRSDGIANETATPSPPPPPLLKQDKQFLMQRLDGGIDNDDDGYLVADSLITDQNVHSRHGITHSRYARHFLMY